MATPRRLGDTIIFLALSQLFLDIKNWSFVGEIKGSINAKMVVIFKDIYSST
jgi:hypothetical protein